MRKFTSLMRLMMAVMLSLIMVMGYAQSVKPTDNKAPNQMEKKSEVKIDNDQSFQNAMDELKKLNSEQPAISGQAAQMTKKSALPVSVSGPVKFNSQLEPTETVLWSQMNDPGTGAAYNSQDFEAAYDTYDNRMSDDFTVTGGPWTIGVVSTVGVYYNGAGPAVGFNIEFFADAAGLPGASLGYYTAAPYTVAGDVFSATLSPSLVLPNGTYWVSIQARMDFGAGGQFGIAPALAPQVLTVGHWINPGNGFGTGATTWTPMTTVWPAVEGPNWCFQLETPVTCPAPTALFTDNITPTSARANWTAGGGETSWIIEYGTAGFTPGTGTSVTVATPFYTMPGLSLGYYSWYVRAVCGVGNESSNSGPVNFSTYPPPYNDECTGAIVQTLLDGVPATFTGNNNGATQSTPSFPMPDVWEAFTITGTATVTLDYCGSGSGTPWGNAWLNLSLDCPTTTVSAGGAYDFTTCGDGNVTITWTALAAGTYWYPVMLDQTNDAAGAYTLHVVATYLTGGTGCENTSPYGSATVNPAGALTTISSCSYAGEYSTIYGITAGETYQFIMSDLGTGAYITITDAAGTAGNILAYGPSPLNYVAAASGTLYAHWSLNEFCGTDALCHVTTVQCTSCSGGAPVNDNCASATAIGEVTDLAFNTGAATFDGPGLCMTSPNIWYNYTATVAGDLTIDLCGSTYDTYLGVYSGFDCATMVNIACNDDSGPACSGLQSSIIIPGVVAGGQYKIEVGGFGSNAGAGDLTVYIAAPCVLTCPPGSILEGEATIPDEGLDVTNGGCNNTPPIYTSINVGDTYCGTANTYLYTGSEYRDTDWYRLDLTGGSIPSELTWSVTAEFPLVIFFIDAGTEDCVDYTVLGTTTAAPCVTASLTVTGLLPKVYWVLAMPSVFTGVPPSDYVATLTGKYRVYGNVYYGATGTTKPMETNTTVTLSPFGTVATGALGYYEFGGVADGSYLLTGATTKAAGGIQSADALLVQRYILGAISLTNLQKRAADVNASNTITTADPLTIKRKVLVPSLVWAAPAYVFDGPFGTPPVNGGMPINVNGADVVQDLRTLSSGDVNGSFTPAP